MNMDIGLSSNAQSDFMAFLRAEGLLEMASVERAKMAARQSGQALVSVIPMLGLLEEEQVAQSLCSFLGLRRTPEEQIPHVPLELVGIKSDYFHAAGLILCDANDDAIEIATADPFDDEYARNIAYFTGRSVRLSVATPSVIQKAILRYCGDSSTDAGLDEQVHQATTSGDLEKLRDMASDAPIVRRLNQLLVHAVECGASDIHFEPAEQKLHVRFRIDGTLQLIDSFGLDQHLGLVSRIKVLSKLNIAEQRLPQDGRMRLPVRGKNIDFRVATAPTVSGESVVLRILDRKDVALDFSILGFSSDDQVQLRRCLQFRDGIVLVTGPTGSGKTTTLYAALTDRKSVV